MPRDLVFSNSFDDLPSNVSWTRLLGDITVGRLSDYRYPELPATARGQRALAVHWTRGGGLVSLGPTARAEDGSDVEVPGWWLDLDWTQLNRLIKFLRNARDQAFGRPE